MRCVDVDKLITFHNMYAVALCVRVCAVSCHHSRVSDVCSIKSIAITHVLCALFVFIRPNPQNVDHKMKLRSKKGQLPFVEVNGVEIADSAVIIRELSQKTGSDLDAGLTQDQRNIAHATTSMIENHLTWVLFWWRTKYPEQMLKGYQVNLQHALGVRLPNAILNFVFKFSYGRKVSN